MAVDKHESRKFIGNIKAMLYYLQLPNMMLKSFCFVGHSFGFNKEQITLSSDWRMELFKSAADVTFPSYCY